MNYYLLTVVALLVFTLNYCDSSSLSKREVQQTEDLYKNDGLLSTVEKLVGQVAHLLQSSLGSVLGIVDTLLADVQKLLLGDNNQMSEVERNTLKELESALKNMQGIVKKEQENQAANGTHSK